jgi:uncharacterized membrane protein (UPF0127 family)
MRMVRVVNTRVDRELGTRIGMADSWLARLRGMLARPEPRMGEGLFLTPCSSVHMFGMRFPLDVVFLDGNGTVVAIYPSLAPGSRTRWHRNAAHALELRDGALARSGTALGDVLIWSPTAVAPSADARTEIAS